MSEYLAADHNLASCPFCGGTRIYRFLPTCRPETPYDPKDRLYPQVMCGTCRATVPGENGDYSGKTAIAAWNHRT